jgi:hypothetical protein
MTNRIFVKEKGAGSKCTGTAAQRTTVLVRANRASGNSPFVGLYERMADNELGIQQFFDTN